MKIRVREVLKVCALLALIAGAIWAFNDTLRELVRGEDRDALVAAALSAQRTSLLSGQKLPIVFVHGINDTGAGWDEMKTYATTSLGWTDNLLYANSFSCNGLVGCSNISNASEIAQWVNAASTAHGGSQVILVAHSMGGVSSRYFMKNNPAATKVAAFISMASMNNGLPLTCPAAGFKILGFDVGATICNELSRTGQFIPTLWKTSYDGIPSVNFYSSGDKTVSTYAAMVPGACNVMVDNVGHSNINRSTLKDSDKTGVPGIPTIQSALQAFLRGDPYNTFCEPGLVAPSIPQLANGIRKVLLVPLKFADSDRVNEYAQRTPGELDALFGTPTQSSPINDYFQTVSGGNMSVSFNRTTPVLLSSDMSSVTDPFRYEEFGGVIWEEGEPATDGTLNTLDKALCGVRDTQNRLIDVSQYTDVVFLSQESAERHRLAQRLDAKELSIRDGRGFYRGAGGLLKVALHDCVTGDVKKPQYQGVIQINTGRDFQDDNELMVGVAHELAHVIGFGHATSKEGPRNQFGNYGNNYDLMGTASHAVGIGGLFVAITNWFPPSHLLTITRSDKYILNPVESGIAPVGLLFNDPAAAPVILERHDGDIDLSLQPVVEAKDSGLLYERAERAFSDPLTAVENSSTLIGNRDGIQPGECGVLDLSNRSAVYRYSEDGRYVDIKFTDDADFTDGEFGCGVDLSIEELSLNREPLVGSPVTVSVLVKSVGDEALSNSYRATLDFVDPDEAETPIGEVTGTKLEVGDEEVLTFSWTPTVAGEGSLVVNLVGVVGDKDPKNNYYDEIVVVKPVSGQSIPTQPVKQRLNFGKTGGGEGAVGISVRSPDGKSHESWSCEIGLEDCSFAASIGSRITLTGHPKDSTAFTGFTGAYCSGLKTCPTFELSGTGSVTLGFVPTAEITLSKDGTGASTGDVALSYLEPGNDTRTECTENCVGKTFTVVAGSQVTATAIPTQNESEFWSWTGCSPSADNKEVCNALAPGIGQELNIKADFKKLIEFRLSPSGVSQGTIQLGITRPNSTRVTLDVPFDAFIKRYPEGTRIDVTYTPPTDLSDKRIRLFEWKYDADHCQESSNTCSTTLDTEDKRFGFSTKYQYEITIGHAGTNGRISLSSSNPSQGSISCPASDSSTACKQGWYWEDSNILITATPNDWYDFKAWIADCGVHDNTCNKNGIKGPATIRADFKRRTWSFTTRQGCTPGAPMGNINQENIYCSRVGVNTFVNGVLRRSGLPGEQYSVTGLDAQNDRLTFTYDKCSTCFENKVWRYLYGDKEPYKFSTNESSAISMYDNSGGNGYKTIRQYTREAIFVTYNQSHGSSFALGTAVSPTELASSGGAGVQAPDQADNTTSGSFASVKEPILALHAFGESPFTVDMLDALTRKVAGALESPPNLVPYDGEIGSRLAAAYVPEVSRVRLPDVLGTIRRAWSSYSSTVQSTLAKALQLIGRANLAAVGDLSDPDLVARRLYVNNCTSECVISPGDSVYLTAIVTNESFVATTNAFGTKLTIHKQGDEATNDLVLYRYSWDGVGSQSATVAEWAFDWIPDVGTYDLTLEVDDWNNIDPNNANDTLTMTVTVSDQPVVLNTGVRDAFGGSVQVRGDAVENITCTTASCSTSPTLGSTVELVATANENRELVKWEGERAADCIITNFATSTCKLRMVNAKDVKAYFETVGPALTLDVETANGGSGSVSSTNTGGARDFASCTDNCTKPFVARSTVVLTATPAAGSYFAEWRGADANRCTISAGGKICTLTVKRDEATEVHALFGKGDVPQQDLTVLRYSDSTGLPSGAVEVLDPLDDDALLYRCIADECTYTLDVPQASGRPLKIVPVPDNGSALDKFVSPTIDLTQDGRFNTVGCSYDITVVDDLDRLKDLEETTWVTCEGNGRITYEGPGEQRVTKVEVYRPSLSRTIDAGAYETVIKKAIGDWAGMSPDDSRIEYQYNNNGLYKLIDDINRFVYTSSSAKRTIARIREPIPSRSLENATFQMHTRAMPEFFEDISVDGYLHITGPNNYQSTFRMDLPGPAYTDEQLGNLLIQEHANQSYSNLATLTAVGEVTANIPATQASNISFRSDHGQRPIRIGEIKLIGKYINPCSSSRDGICTLSLQSNKSAVVPVVFTQGETVSVLGDVNGDGKVLASDALMALRRAVGQTVSGASDIAADVNCDGKIVASDALSILQAAVGSRTLASCSAVQQAASSNFGFTDVQIVGDQYKKVTSYTFDGGEETSYVPLPTDGLGTVSLSMTNAGSGYVYNGTVALTEDGLFTGCTDPCVQTSPTTFSITAPDAGTPHIVSVYLSSKNPQAQLHGGSGNTGSDIDDLGNEDEIQDQSDQVLPPPDDVYTPRPPVPEEPDVSDPLPPAPDEPDISDPLPPAPEEPEISDPLPPVVTPPPSTAQTNLYVAGIRLSPPSPQIRKTVDVNATIGNAGRAKTSGTFNATLRIDQGNDGTWDASKVVRLQTLAGGATVPVTFKKAFRPSGPNVRIQVCVDDLALPTTENFGIIRTPEYFPGAVSETTKSDNCNVMLVNAAERGGGPAAAILSGILIPMYAGPALLVVVLLGGSYLYVRRRKIDVT